MPAFRTQPARPQQGAALVVALIMLVILTILAFSGMSTATTELALAGNEQFRRNAAQAAAAGVEQAISRLIDVPTSAGAPPTLIAPTLLADSNTDRFGTATRFAGEESGLPQSSADKFVGLHFTIQSTGTSARNASDRQTQGVMVVAASGSAGNSTYSQIGGGLE